ncbi:MAG: ABC transporter substrate-binding protein [Halobaculum sp.]
MRENVNRRDVVKAMGAAGIAGLAGCAGGDGTATGTGTGTMGEMTGTEMSSGARYGILMPETGDLGSLGTTIRDGALLPAAQINDSDMDFSVSTQVADTQTNPQAGISGAESLVNAGFPAVVGPASSNVNLQVTREVFIPNQVVGMSPSSTSPAVTQLQDNDYIFRTAPSDALQGPVMAQVAGDRVGASTTATLFLNDAYGQALEESYVSAAKEAGITVQNRVSIEPQQASYTSQLSDALADDPDTLMIVAFPQSGIQLFSDYYNNFDSSNHTIIVPDGLIDDDLPDEVDNDFANVIGTSPATAGPGADFFKSAYKEQFGSSPQVFNAQAYDAGAVLILASAAADELTGTAIRDNIRRVANPGGTEVTPSNLPQGVQSAMNGEDINFQGASSPVNFDENGDMRTVTYGIFQVENRDFTEVDQVQFSN